MTPSVTACVWLTSRPRRARARDERWIASGAAAMAARRRSEGAISRAGRLSVGSRVPLRVLRVVGSGPGALEFGGSGRWGWARGLARTLDRSLVIVPS